MRCQACNRVIPDSILEELPREEFCEECNKEIDRVFKKENDEQVLYLHRS